MYTGLEIPITSCSGLLCILRAIVTSERFHTPSGSPPLSEENSSLSSSLHTYLLLHANPLSSKRKITKRTTRQSAEGECNIIIGCYPFIAWCHSYQQVDKVVKKGCCKYQNIISVTTMIGMHLLMLKIVMMKILSYKVLSCANPKEIKQSAN